MVITIQINNACDRVQPALHTNCAMYDILIKAHQANIHIQPIPYRGFICEVLICVNYASCRGLTNFNSAVILALSFRLTVCVTVMCLWFLYPMSLFKYFKRVDISAFLPNPKGQRTMVVACVHHDDIAAVILQCNSPKHPCRRGILWLQSLSL